MVSSWILAAALFAQAPAPIAPQVPSQTPATVADQATPPAAAPAGQPTTRPAHASTWTDDQPLTHLFQNLAKDLGALASPESGGLLLFGGGAAALLHPRDAAVHNWVVQQPTSSAATLGTAIGDGWVHGGGALAVWAVGAATGRDELAHIGSDLIRAQALNEVLTGSIKVAVNRQRPNGSSRSFPSGHTSATMATAAVIQSHFGWKVGAAAYAVGGFVGWARVRANEHWLSDVAFGATIGAMSGRAVAGKHASAWSVAPVKTPGGVAVIVSRRR